VRRADVLFALFFAALAAPLTAQNRTTLERLSFMSGCWEGPFQGREGSGTIEEHYTSPAVNLIVGTTRYLVNGRATDFEFTLLRADSTGIVLVPFPGGRRSDDVFRLTHLAGDSAVFEAPEHDYPKRILYRLAPDGSLVAQVDSGPDDPAPRVWWMRSATCTSPRASDLAGGLEDTLTAKRAGVIGGPPQPESGRDRSGVGEFVVFETVHFMWLGISAPIALGADGSTPVGFGLLTGGLAGFGVYAYAAANPMSTGQARAWIWGGEWGLWQTLGWAIASSDNLSAEGGFGATAAGLVGGTAVGAMLARRPIASGDASLVIHGSVWGTWFGSVLAVLADQEGDAALRTTLLVGDAGLLAAAFATGRTDWSGSRVWLVTAGGIAGMVAGFGIDIIARADDDKTVLGIPGMTSLAGLAAAAALTRNYDRTRTARAGDGPTGTLLAVRGGRLRLDIPVPAPTLVPHQRSDGTRDWRPGVRITLASIRH